MHPVLSSAFQACLNELEAVDTTTAQIHPRSNLRAPSIQQHVERHIAAAQSTCARLEKRLKKGRVPHQIRRTRLEWGLQLMILSVGYIPDSTPLIDYQILSPLNLGSVSGKDLGRHLGSELAQLDGLLDACRKSFGMERFEFHPLLGPLRVDQWRRCEVLQLRLLGKSIALIRRESLSPVVRSAPRAARA